MSLPPGDEEPQLLPHLVDILAETEPGAVYGKYPADPTDYGAGFETVTFRQLANAVNAVARWLDAEIGPGDRKQTPVIAYLGPNEFRYVFAFLGAMKAGYKVFLPSPRNSLAAHLALLENLDCSNLIIAGPITPATEEILNNRPMKLLRIGEMKDLMNTPAQPYPYNATLAEAKTCHAWVTHTSGTTGIPKPCIYTHEFTLRIARTFTLPTPRGFTSLQSLMSRNSHVLLLPLFHPGGIQLGILNAIYARCVVILPSWTQPPSTEDLIDLLHNVQADWIMSAPFTLETLAKDEAKLNDVASRVKTIVFAGGALPKVLGDIIANKLRLASFLGSSETAGLPIIYPEDVDLAKDWDYMAFHPKSGAVLRPETQDVSALVLVKSPSTEPYQPVFERFSDQESFVTGDLFRQHPTRPDMWTHASRADDIIVFLNGEKTNPVSFENHLLKHPDISGAVMFGSQRFEPGILIELKADAPLSPQGKADYITKLWPTIEEANHDSPAHARIAKSHVLFTDPTKPCLRTPKGTVMRKLTIDLYSQEIDFLYKSVEALDADLSGNETDRVDVEDVESLVRLIQTACEESTLLSTIHPDTNLLLSGVDSLQVLRLCRNLKFKIPGGEKLKPVMIYSNPTPESLARAIQSAVGHNDRVANDAKLESMSKLEKTLSTYIGQIDKVAHTSSCIITGTTGTIGTYLLKSLMTNSAIDTIYCLNRGADSAKRQRLHNQEVDPELPTEFPDNIHFLEADLTDKYLGLGEEAYKKILSSVKFVVHNAWSVDFNSPLSSFTTQLDGVKRLIEFANASQRHAKIIFLSSVGAVMDLALRPGQTVPEAVLEDLSVTSPVGYAESKYLAERVLAYASQQLGLAVAIARVGQVCGAVHSPGRWNPKEWLPRLISSGMALKAIPDSLGQYDAATADVDWIPVDVLANVIVDLMLQQSATQNLQVYNLANPRPTSWRELVPTVVKSLNSLQDGAQDGAQAAGDKTPIAAVPRDAWLKQARSAQDEERAADMVPALKLLDFYEEKLVEKECPRYAVENAMAASPALQELGAIRSEDMEKWIRLWFKDGVAPI